MISLEARLEHALDWTEPRPIMTKRGGTLMRCAPPTERFWYLWKRYKPETRKLGILPRKIGTEWEVVQFMDGHLHEIEADIEHMNTAGLLDWQIEPMKRLVKVLRTRISAIDSSDTGTGKTYVACAVARQLGLELAVICPKAVIPSWAEAAKHIGCEVRFILNYEALKAKKGEKYVLWDKEGYAVWKIKSGEQVLLVFDEAHRCKDPALSKNALLLVSAVAQKIRHLLVSATLAESPLQLRAAGYSLGLHNGKDFWDWCVKMGCWKDGWNGWHFNGAQRVMKKIRDEIYPKRGVRVRAKDLGDKFPETIVTADLIEADGVGDIYESLRDRLAKVDRETKNYSATIFTEILGARRRVELLKVPAMLSLAKDALAEGSSVALFVCFNETVEALRTELKCPAITGQTPLAEREKFKKEFQADQIRSLVLNISAGGVGISLHGQRHRVALISPSWSAFELVQCIGRVWRAGGSHSIQRILFASKTIEEAICARVRAKIGCLETLNDGDTAGIQVSRSAGSVKSARPAHSGTSAPKPVRNRSRRSSV